MPGLHAEVQSNKRRSVVLIAAFVVLVVAVGAAFNYLLNGGVIGLVIAFAFAIGSSFTAYWSSDKVALAMSRARPADPLDYAQLHNLVEGLAIAAGLPKPRVYIVDDAAPNAFATGRNPEHAAIAVTTGLLEIMNRVELEGVLAHELAHIKHRDVLLQTVVVVIATAIVESSRIGGYFQRALLFVLGPLAAAFVHLLLSPRREFDADRLAADLCGSPHGLADALVRLDQAMELVAFEASPATEPLYTTNPFAEEGLAALFNSHPPVGERVRRLRELDPDWREKLRAA